MIFKIENTRYSADELRMLCAEKSGVDNIIEFERQEVEHLIREDIEFRKGIVENMIEKGRAVGHPQNHTFSAIGQTQHTAYMSSYAVKSFSMYQEAIKRTEEKTKQLCKLLNIDYPTTEDEFSKLFNFCFEIEERKNLPEKWILCDKFFIFVEDLGTFTKLQKNNFALEKEIFENWVREIENINAKVLLDELNEALEKNIVIRKMKFSSLMKKLSPYSRAVIKQENVQKTLENICQYQKNKVKIQIIREKYKDLLFEDGAGVDSVQHQKLCEYYIVSKNIIDKIRDIKAESYLKLLTKENQDKLYGYYTTWKTFCEVRGGIQKMFMLNSSRISFIGNFLSSEMNFCNICKDNIDMLKNWIEWNAVKKIAKENGLEKVCEAYESGLVHETVLDAYEKGIYKALYRLCVEGS